MSAKKKKKPGAAQHLIDSLLDERTPSPRKTSEISGAVRLGDDDSQSARNIPPQTKGETASVSDGAPVLINADEHELRSDLELEGEESFQKTAVKSGVSRRPDESSAASFEEDQATKTGATIETSQSFPSSPSLGSAGDPTEDPAEDQEHERTIRLDTKAKKKDRNFSVVTGSQVTALETQVPAPPSVDEAEASQVDRAGLTDWKTALKPKSGAVGRSNHPVSTNVYPSSEAALRQSESLRIAQARISELEAELERLRRDNEKLASAGETLSRRSDELVAKTENLGIQNKEAERIHEEEKKVFRGQVQQKEREIGDLRARLEEMEARLENNFKKIRVRERELEHRLEIVRMESQTLVSTKDKMILDLKRQIDQLTHENEYAKQKTQELFNQYKDKQETARRVVRALRIALTILEGDEDSKGKKT